MPRRSEKPSAVAAAQDDSVFVAYEKTGRIEKYSSEGTIDHLLERNRWRGGKFAFDRRDSRLAASSCMRWLDLHSQIRVWTLDGQHKIDAELGEHLGSIAAPQIAVTPHDELLVFDPSAPRVYRFRIHL